MVDVMDAHQAAKTWDWKRDQTPYTTFIEVPRDYRPSVKTIKVASINDTVGCAKRAAPAPKPFATWMDEWFTPTGRPRITRKPLNGKPNGHRPKPRPVEVKAVDPTPRKEVKPMATKTVNDLGFTVAQTGTSKGGRAMAKLENRDDKFLVIVYAPEGQQVQAIIDRLTN